MTDKITTLLDSNEALNLSLEGGYLSDITREKNNLGDADFITSEEKYALDPDTILSMTLSGIFGEIRSQPETNIVNSSLEPTSKEKNTLNVDNNVNALSINVVVAFCWWAVNYIIASVANICNYRESPSQQQQEEPFDIAKLWLNDPVYFEHMQMGGDTGDGCDWSDGDD